MSMKSICMYTPTANGGHARYTWELLTALANQKRPGHGYELVSSRNLNEEYNSPLYPIHRILPPIADRATFSNRASWIANRLMHYPRRELQFLKWLRGRPDVTGVHLQEWTPWLATHMIRRIRSMGKQVFYTAHNVVPHKFPFGVPKALMLHWIRSACRRCDGLFVHTDNLSGELSRFLGAAHPPIHVVPHGVWTVPERAAPAPLKDRLASKRLLCFGAIRTNKGIDLLLRAMDHLPGYSVTIAGEPYHLDYYQSQILPQVRRLREKGVQVDLLDRFIHEEEIPGLFASHSAIMLPYTRGFVAQSGVAFMALAYDLPVIASEVGGLRDLLEEFKIGTTFSEPTPEALAAAVLALYAQPEEKLAQEIRRARHRYSWQQAARATATGYGLAAEKVNQLDDCPVTTTAAS